MTQRGSLRQRVQRSLTRVVPQPPCRYGGLTRRRTISAKRPWAGRPHPSTRIGFATSHGRRRRSIRCSRRAHRWVGRNRPVPCRGARRMPRPTAVRRCTASRGRALTARVCTQCVVLRTRRCGSGRSATASGNRCSCALRITHSRLARCRGGSAGVSAGISWRSRLPTRPSLFGSSSSMATGRVPPVSVHTRAHDASRSLPSPQHTRPLTQPAQLGCPRPSHADALRRFASALFVCIQNIQDEPAQAQQ